MLTVLKCSVQLEGAIGIATVWANGRLTTLLSNDQGQLFELMGTTSHQGLELAPPMALVVSREAK